MTRKIIDLDVGSPPVDHCREVLLPGQSEMFTLRAPQEEESECEIGLRVAEPAQAASLKPVPKKAAPAKPKK